MQVVHVVMQSPMGNELEACSPESVRRFHMTKLQVTLYYAHRYSPQLPNPTTIMLIEEYLRNESKRHHCRASLKRYIKITETKLETNKSRRRLILYVRVPRRHILGLEDEDDAN